MCCSMNRIVGLIVMYRLSLPCPGLCPSPCRKSYLGPNLGASPTVPPDSNHTQ